ncbi:MAG: mechanosensitive ion channel domain-containing protein [Candidatus Hadarchaeia archaeon]
MNFELSLSYFLRVILPAIIVAVGSLAVERTISHKVTGFGRNKKLPASHVHAVKLVTRWIIVIVDILILAALFGLAIGRLWMVISAIAAMVIIGFIAVWSILGNILAALVIMIWRPFQIGEDIEILPDKIAGRAKETNLFFTKIKSEEGDIISVPNTQIMQKFIKVKSPKSNKGESE